MMSNSFGARLRAERERHGIALAAIADSTKISIGLLEAIERDDPSRWPSGIFRRAFIRAYADAVGLDREATVREFLQRFPDPAGEPRPLAAAGECPHAASYETRAADAGNLRLTLADESSRFGSAQLTALSGGWRRAAAALYDLAIVVGMAALVFAVVGHFWTPLTITTLCYYFGGVLTMGTSPCARLLARRPEDAGDRRTTRFTLEANTRAVEPADDLAPGFSFGRSTKTV
jgi:transcriptional regulator with XRE-family HTH domain